MLTLVYLNHNCCCTISNADLNTLSLAIAYFGVASKPSIGKIGRVGIHHCTMGISACEKCINKKDETQNKGKKWLNLASFFGQKSLKYWKNDV